MIILTSNSSIALLSIEAVFSSSSISSIVYLTILHFYYLRIIKFNLSRKIAILSRKSGLLS